MATGLLYFPLGVLLVFSGLTEGQLRRLPLIPKKFSLHMEIIDVSGKQVASSREMIDYDGRLARLDVVPKSDSDLHQKYGNSPVTLVSDFKTGYRYVIDRWSRNCTMEKLPEHSWISDQGSDKFIVMKHSYDIFDRIRSSDMYVYIGETSMRNLSVIQWRKLSDNAEEDIFILQRDWSAISEESDSIFIDIPVGLRVKTYHKTTGNVESDVVYHIYDFYSGHDQKLTFSVEDCFSFSNQYKDLTFMMEGTYFSNVYGKHEKIYTAVTNAIAKHAQISALRVTDLYITQTTPFYIDILFSLRETPAKLHNVDNPVVEPSLADAYENFKKAVKKGFTITVPYKSGTTDLKILESSLSSRTKWYSSEEVTYKFYTPGAMAGLGIGMILLGFIVGVGAAFFIQKHLNTEVPYKVTE